MSNLDKNDSFFYNDLVKSFQINPRDIHTHPIIAAPQKLFHVYVKNNEIYVCNSINQRPSVSIKQHRKITLKEFEIMYDLYLRREKGDTVSQIAQQESQNASYWFGIFFELEHKE